MKNTLQFPLTVLVFFATFLFIEPLFDWFKGEVYIITTEGIAEAMFFGTVVPLVMLLSKKVKNHYVFVVLAIVIMVAAAFIKNVVLSWFGM